MLWDWCLTLFWMEGEGTKKALPTSFSPVTFTNVGISPQNFLTFSFNPFATLVENLKKSGCSGQILIKLIKLRL